MSSIHLNKNLQKRTKKDKYDAEKDFMGSLKDVGCAVGEYVGDGKGEDGTDPLDDAAEADLPDSHDTDDRNEHGSTSLPLLVFYDFEAT